MSGSTMKASLLLTLEDKLSSGLDRLVSLLDKLSATIERITASLGRLDLKRPFEDATGPIDRATAALARSEHQMGILGRTAQGLHTHMRSLGAAAERMGVMGAIAGGVGLIAPVRAYAGYENTLRHIAITEKLSGGAAETEIGRLNALFASDAIASGQSSESIAKAYSDLVQTGIPAAMLDRVIGMHSMAATAYNISPEALGPAVGALLQNLKVPEGEIGAALAAMAYASKEGRFKVEDFSRQLPGVAGLFDAFGMHGRGSANVAFAALETVMRNSSEPNQAASSFYDALNYITGPMAAKSFKRAGVDLPGLLRGAEKNGTNPLDAILGKLGEMTAGHSPMDAAMILHGVLHNQQAAQAVLALLLHKDEFARLRATLGAVGEDTLARDETTAALAPAVQLRVLDETVAQLTRRLGEGFVPVMHAANGALLGLLGLLRDVDGAAPGVSNGVIIAVGAFLALVAAVGALGFVLPVVIAGFSFLGAAVGLLLDPFVLLAIGIAVAIADIVLHWDRFKSYFQEMGTALALIGTGIADFFSGIFHDDMAQTVKGFEEVWGGLKGFFSGLFDVIKQTFVDFDDFMAGKLGKDWKLGGVDPKAFGSGPPPEAAWLGYHAPVQGEIVVRAAPGTRIESTTSTGVRLREGNPGSAGTREPDPGRVVGRP